jgi:hypothetical protein
MIKLRMGRIGPMASALRCGGLRTGRVATWPVPGPWPRQRGPRGGAASDGSPVDRVRHGRRRKHPRSAVKAPGNRKRNGAHPSGDST